MSNWDSYEREERTRLTPGDYRVEIVSVDEKESKAGNPMLVIGIRPNGSSITINHYIVQGNEWTNRNLTEFLTPLISMMETSPCLPGSGLLELPG